MIVIGVDVHKHALTAVAVDGLGRAVAERTSAVNAEPLLEWTRPQHLAQTALAAPCSA